MVKSYLTALLTALFFTSFSQSDLSFLGGRPDAQIIVTTSSDEYRQGWHDIASGHKTIDGKGLDARRLEASRFLAQATLGADEQMIQQAVDMGFEAWIEEQFVIEPTLYLETLQQIYQVIYNQFLSEGNDPNEFRCRPRWYHTNYAWWEMIMTGDDLLRQRIALALSEILVISKAHSDLENYGYGVASFYDIFIKNAFGNYADILREVTLHPAMGNYLSHLNNPKANPEEFIFPDQNYGREFMQLFTVGIHLLNPDGTKKLDPTGSPIDAYNDDEIEGISSVFTGLGAGATACGESFAPHLDLASGVSI